MNIKSFFALIGLKEKTKTYGSIINNVDLGNYGNFKIASWLHPKANVFVPTMQEIDAIKTFVSEGDSCIDIGAHIGDTTIPMAIAVGNKGNVIALEPNKYVFAILNENASLNKNLNIIPLNYAATEENIEMEFEYSDSGFCNGGFHENMSIWTHGHAYKLKVNGIQLNNYLAENYKELIPKITYIKVDAEGYDFTIIKTLEELIRKNKPYIRTEVYKKSNLQYKKDFFTYLFSLGYDLFYFKSNNEYKGNPIRLSDTFADNTHFDIFCVPKLV